MNDIQNVMVEILGDLEQREKKTEKKTKTLTPERRKQIDDWLDEKLVPVYRNPTKIEAARTLLHKMDLKDQYLEEIFNTVLERNRYRKWCKENNRFWPEDPNLHTFIKDRIWKDPIPMCTDQQEKPKEKGKCECGSYSNGPDGLCAWCWSKKYANEGRTGLKALREQYKKMGLEKRAGETMAEHVRRCKEIARVQAAKIGGGKAS